MKVCDRCKGCENFQLYDDGLTKGGCVLELSGNCLTEDVVKDWKSIDINYEDLVMRGLCDSQQRLLLYTKQKFSILRYSHIWR